MRDPKDRLHRVLVVGANPAGLAATTKLGEMGIPVTLVDRDPDLDRKLAAEAWRLDSGVPFNHAMRPGLLRVLRNSQIRCILPGEISSLKHTPQGFCAHFKNFESYIDPDRCVLCGRCAEVCPATTGDGSKPIHYHGRQSLPGRPVIDKRRQPLCQAGCPLGVNVQGYVALVRAGRFREALELIRRDNVLPGICGRVCTHPCEAACRRGELDEPLAIRDIKRFVADHERTGAELNDVMPPPTRSEPIAVVGSGPAGLAAAADLARLGYPITVFEKELEPGGLLRYGIGPYRLPRDILEREIDVIRKLGVAFITGTPIDPAAGLDPLTAHYRAVLLTTGAWVDRKLGAPGEECQGVEGCLQFLGRLYREELKELKEKVAVIGDGNAAFDVARAAVRLGAEVTLLSWFPADLIPANPEEIRAATEEGVHFVYSAQVTAFLGDGNRLMGLRCMPTRPGEPDAKGVPWPIIIPGEGAFELAFDRAIVAIGQVGAFSGLNPAHPLSATGSGYLVVDGSYRTNVSRVFAAGDAVRGPSSVVEAMANGREAARAVHRDISGEKPGRACSNRPTARDFPELPKDTPKLPRPRMPERGPEGRKDLRLEVALGYDEAQARFEAARCLQCGVCSECLQCLEVCGQQGPIRHDEGSAKGIEHAGVVIIADPEAAPAIRGEDVIRAYSKKTEKDDVHSMMLRGFAAATEAMLLLGGSSQRLKGHGLSFSPPDPQLSPEVRIGVFVCRCKDSLGWSEALDHYLAGLTSQPNIVYTEALVSACVPDGSAGILRTIRERRLTRVVLGSCVCCPLNFVCSSCTDPRSRLKSALFNATGISRAMVETCNLRGEVLRFLKEDPGLAMARFKGLVERSIGRARRLKSLLAPARRYNFTTAVVADSEASVRSALALAEAGMEVFLFGSREKPLADSPAHVNIHCFLGSAVTRLRGTVGNFEVTTETSGREREFQVGAVILGEPSRRRIPYIPLEELRARPVEASMQKRGVSGVPFFTPGSTSVPGLFLANPPGMNVSERIKGEAAAILAASVMPRSPRQNKGYTVVVDDLLCRGCGRCVEICPYHAVSYSPNAVGGYHALVDEALCKGCGNCIAVCPSGAADCRYRDRLYLEQMIDEMLL
jgi:NADPH-dependent glutamate synthase beta subunit-like oxidoreductase/NAD-dependent dihydropyrimidine dehydrogenase PreA subunit